MKQRVTTTFRQAIDLYQEGRLDEVVAGCDLILEMDSRHEPAQRLRQKAMNPSAAIEILDLLEGDEAPEGQPAGSGNDEVMAAVEALGRREFQTAIDLCNSVLAREPDNEQAQQLGARAFERLEAAPFVEQFLDQCRAELDAGEREKAAATLEKARSLDASHPDVDQLQQKLDSGVTGAESTPETSAGASGTSFDFGEGDSPFAAAFSGPGSSAGPPSSNEPRQGSTPNHSFVVETSGASGTDEAIAADFGFVFEEAPEHAAAPGGEPQSAGPPTDEEPPVGEAHTFDFAAAEVEVSDDDRQRVAQFITEGDAAFERGEIQDAIDIWSRIFLIDVTNEDASSRIDQAKKKRMEVDQQVDGLMLEATRAYEAGDYAGATAAFNRVLEIDPVNLTAKEHLEKLRDLDAAMVGSAKETPPPVTMPSTPPATDLLDEDLGFEDEPFGSMPPPPPPPAKREPSPGTTPTGPASGSAPKKRAPMGAILVVAAIAVLAVGGWFGYRTFFGSNKPAAAGATETQARIDQAQNLARQGNLDKAIEILSTIRPQDANHERALEMIAELKVRQQRESGTIRGKQAQKVYADLLQQGQNAFDANDYLGAKKAFEEASAIQQLPPDLRELYDTASDKVSQLNSATLLFKEGNYRDAINNLETILQTDPQNRNAQQMLIDAHYDLGAQALKDGRLDDAMGQFDKVLEQDPDDEIARRSRDLAQRYKDAPKDLLFQIYAKYLPLR